MKVKLLKKVRKEFRIVKNELGRTKIQEIGLFGWEDYRQPLESICIQRYIGGIVVPNREGLLKIICYRYRKYTRKYKINQVKYNNWTKTWYNK